MTETVSKNVRVGEFVFEITKTTEFVQFPWEEYEEKRLTIKNAHKNYEVSLMKNHWDAERVDREDNYREIAVIHEDGYIEPVVRFPIRECDSKEVLAFALKIFAMAETAQEFFELSYK